MWLRHTTPDTHRVDMVTLEELNRPPADLHARNVLACVCPAWRGTITTLARKGHKYEESVLCVNSDTSRPVPRSTSRTGMFYRILSKRRQLSIQRFAPRNWGSLLRVECSKSMHTVKTAHCHL
jgi:hypothetical protein